MDNTDIDQNVIEAIKYEYYSQLKRNVPKSDPQLDTAAAKAALICAELNCDPAIYVAAQIKNWVPLEVKGRKFTYMLPTQLAGPKARNNVHMFRRVNKGNTWQGIWDVQKKRLTTAIRNTPRTVEEILMDHSIDFDSWFRCLLTKEPNPKIIAKWGPKAYQELQSDQLRTFIDGLQKTEGVKLDISRIIKI